MDGVGDVDWKYGQTQPNRSDWLSVSSSHRIYWEEYGNPHGEPVLFLHGGPGGGTVPAFSRFFNPSRYRILLFDQRGCGKSLPSANADDPRLALRDNTTPHLIADIIALRRALGIAGKMHVFGGSWGSTLALAYAIAHPDTVQTLILRGIFLCRRQDLDYFYQGNAASYAENAQDAALPGAYLFYPEAWKAYVEAIPQAARGDMIYAYGQHFTARPETDAQRQRLTQAATAWSVWEGITSYLAANIRDPGKFADPDFARAFARIENHYFLNGAFLGGSGTENRNQNYILENVEKIKSIPLYIVHGRYDQVCPLVQAEALAAALRAISAPPASYRVTTAGHSMLERENCLALTDIMDGLPPMPRS